MKLRGRLKTKEENYQEVEMMAKERKIPEENIPETQQKPQEVPIKEYQETLYSKDTTGKQQVIQVEEKKKPVKRTSWENVDTIEQSVDAMEEKPMKSRGRETGCGSKVLEKKVDRIILKKKIKP